MEIFSVSQVSNANSQPPTVTVARILTRQLLDREDVQLYQLTLIAQDRTDRPLAASVPVNVTVLDVNDNDPIFPRPSFSFNISEGTSDQLVMEFSVSVAGYHERKICGPTGPSILFVYLFTYLFVCLSVCLSLCLFLVSFICLFVCLLLLFLVVVTSQEVLY